MRKSLQTMLFVILLQLASGCGVLNSIKTEKSKSSRDSTSIKAELWNNTDTGTINTYERFGVLLPGEYAVSTESHFRDIAIGLEQKDISTEQNLILKKYYEDLIINNKGMSAAELAVIKKNYKLLIADQKQALLVLYEKFTNEKKGITTSGEKKEESTMNEINSSKVKDKDVSILVIAAAVFLIALLLFVFKK